MQADMEYVDLPTLEGTVSMPLLGLGAWQIMDEDVVGSALELNYPLIDTAQVYFNEAVVGSAVRKYLDSHKKSREDVFITSKLGPAFMTSAEHVLQSVDNSLKKLNTDYIDLFLVHTPRASQYHDPENPMGFDPTNGEPTFAVADHRQVWRALEQCVEDAKIRAIGVSNFNMKQLDHVMESARVPVANNQVEVHAYMSQEPLRSYCSARGVSVTSYGSFCSPGSANRPGFRSADVPLPLKDPVVAGIGEKHGKSPGQVLLRNLVQRKIAVIPKSASPQRQKENRNIFDFTLDEDDMAKIAKLNREKRTFVYSRYADHPTKMF